MVKSKTTMDSNQAHKILNLLNISYDNRSTIYILRHMLGDVNVHVSLVSILVQIVSQALRLKTIRIGCMLGLK